MPGWLADVVATFVLSAASAYGFLRLRCQGTGRAFGPRAQWWAVAIVVITAAVSTGLGVAAVAVSPYVRAVYVGLILPSGLWLGALFTQRIQQRGSLVPQRLAACLTLPLRRHSERMTDDMQDWCDVRVRAVWQKPQGIVEGTRYYYNQVANRVKNPESQEDLGRRRDSIVHKVKIVQMIDRRTGSDKVWDALQSHPGTRNTRRYPTDNLEYLARRLVYDAGGEMVLFLAEIYRLGYRKLLIYPFRMPDPGYRP
jgi:hypothetical protein